MRCLKQRMPLTTGVSTAGVRKPPTTPDTRHFTAAGPASQPPWTQGTSHSLSVYRLSLLLPPSVEFVFKLVCQFDNMSAEVNFRNLEV